jgi:mycofactocin precursor peptide peptidase
VLLADLAWPDVGGRVTTDSVLAVPLGATEQHGPHLPLSTDTDVAVALCQRLAEARADVLIAPAVAYGSSGEHQEFPGTLSIGQEAVELLLVELGRSASRTFAHLVFVCAHGGNAEPAARATMRLRAESRDVLLFRTAWAGDAHAGHTETSLMLHLAPARIRMASAVPGDTRPLAEIWPLLRAGGVRAISESGVLGDPAGATAGAGRALLDGLSAALVREVAAWHPEVPG